MRPVAAQATVIVLLNLLIASVHGLAHRQLGVELELWQWTFVAVVIVAAPVLAVVLYWTRFRQAGALLLFLSMVGGLLFGAYYHFVIPSPDHVAHLPQGEGRPLFVGTAILLVPAEAVGALFAIWSWRAGGRGLR
jgi:hypothetical protein